MFSPSVLPKIRGVFRGSDVEINTEGYRSGHNGADSKSVWVQAHVGSNPILSANFCKKVSISPGTFFELKCQDISQKHVRFLSFFHFNHNLIISLRNQVCYHQCFAVTTNALYVTISNLSNISNTRETEFTLASYYIQVLNISIFC